MTLTQNDLDKIYLMIKDFVFQAFESHARYSEMKENSKNQECSAFDENSSIVHVTKDYLHKLQEKAQKWNEMVAVNSDSAFVVEWKEKAQKYDDLTENHQIRQWKDKAEKFDELIKWLTGINKNNIEGYGCER